MLHVARASDFWIGSAIEDAGPRIHVSPPYWDNILNINTLQAELLSIGIKNTSLGRDRFTLRMKTGDIISVAPRDDGVVIRRGKTIHALRKSEALAVAAMLRAEVVRATEMAIAA